MTAMQANITVGSGTHKKSLVSIWRIDPMSFDQQTREISTEELNRPTS
jgi:hypothetical protein